VTPIANTQAEIQKSGLSEVDQAIAQKDAHFIDIAIATGKFVTSNDKIARGVFSAIAQNTALLDGLIWAVPTDCSHALADLLENGGIVPSNWLVRAT
jgi:hypothetical protein